MSSPLTLMGCRKKQLQKGKCTLGRAQEEKTAFRPNPDKKKF